MQVIRPEAALVAIHDSARPLVQADDVRKCLLDALQARLLRICLPALDTPCLAGSALSW